MPITITPAMLEAGASALLSIHGIAPTGVMFDPEEAARRVYEAMRKAYGPTSYPAVVEIDGISVKVLSPAGSYIAERAGRGEGWMVARTIDLVPVVEFGGARLTADKFFAMHVAESLNSGNFKIVRQYDDEQQPSNT